MSRSANSGLAARRREVRFTVVGNPGNRRVAGFTSAVRRAGLPEPVVLPWSAVAAGTAPLTGGTLVRIDSPGEDAEVDRILRGAATPAEHGSIEGLAAWYEGFTSSLRRLGSAVAAAPGAVALNQPDDLAVLFDKRRCHARLERAGVPVPPALPLAHAVTGYDGLRSALRGVGWSRAFVKPAHGSSASGVLALMVSPCRVRAVTSVELVRERPARALRGGEAGRVRLFNSLRIRAYDQERDVAAMVDALAPDGLHVERWLPKAGLGGRVLDLRVVVIAGRPTHVVCRTSTSPMTNLHLGNARGDLPRLRAAMGERAWAAAMTTCMDAAACFPRTLHVGVDLLIAPCWRRHAVAEVNAFGDLLPGVLSDGRDTYAEQVNAVLAGRHLTWAAA